MDWGATSNGKESGERPSLSEDRATLLYILDIYNKHLFEIQNHSVRKVRTKLDSFAKELVQPRLTEATEKNSVSLKTIHFQLSH